MAAISPVSSIKHIKVLDKFQRECYFVTDQLETVCVVQSLNDDGDRGKIKEQKYSENAVKNKSIVRANLSRPSLKENVEKCRQTKNIN